MSHSVGGSLSLQTVPLLVPLDYIYVDISTVISEEVISVLRSCISIRRHVHSSHDSPFSLWLSTSIYNIHSYSIQTLFYTQQKIVF